MQSLQEQFSVDLIKDRYNFSKSPTEINRYDMYCSSCHASYYVDKAFYESIVTAIEEGLDNPFVCEDCRDELAEFENRRGH